MAELKYSLPSRDGRAVETLMISPPDFAAIAKGRAHLTWNQIQWQSTEMYKRLRALAKAAADTASERNDLVAKAKTGDESALEELRRITDLEVEARYDAMNTTEEELSLYYSQINVGWDIALPLVTGMLRDGVEVQDWKTTIAGSPYYVPHLAEIARRVFMGDWEEWKDNVVTLEAANAPDSQ